MSRVRRAAVAEEEVGTEYTPSDSSVVFVSPQSAKLGPLLASGFELGSLSCTRRVTSCFPLAGPSMHAQIQIMPR